MDDNKKKLYEALSKDYDMGTYEQFCKDIQDSGKRKRLYDATSKDYDYGSFDSFNKQLGFVATAKPAVPANSQSKPSAPQKPVQKPTAATRPAQKPRQTGTPLTEAYKQKMLGETSQMLAQTQAGLQRTKNRMDYMSANTGLQVPKVKLGEKGGGIKLGQNNKVVSRKKLNPETGKEEQTFITESGNEFDNRAEADLEQNSVDDARYQLEHREDWLRQQRRVLAARLAKRGEELDAEAVNFSWRDMPRGSGGAIHTYNSSTVNGRFADTQYKNMLAQIKKIDDTLATLEEARKGIASDKWIDDSSSWAAKKGKQLLAFGAGAWRGLAHAVGKVSTWDLGLTDINTNGSVLDAAQNADRVGFDNISQDERDLLNLTAISNEVQSENADHIGRGYKAGEVTGESLPFMLEMILNPASGLGEAAVKRMTQEAIKRFGKDAVKKAAKKYLAAKIGTRLIGDAAGSAVMAGTSGLGHVTADTLNRLTGDVQFKQDETGHIVYGGREGAEDSVAKAFLKAFGAQTIENHSEMVGEYFAPLLGKASKVVRKGMDKVGLGSVNRFIDNVGATNFAKMIGDFEKHSKWNGTIGEYAEEVVGNIENALLVGDNTLDTAKNTGVFNLDQNIDTFLGVSLMGGFLSGAKTLSYRGPKRQTMNEMSEAGKAIDHAIGGDIHWMEKWGGWRNTFLVGTDEEKTAALREVMDNTDLPIGFRMGVLNFVKAAQKYEGLTRAQESKLQNGEQDPVAAGYDESYDRGYDTTEPEAMNDAKNLLDMKRGQLAQQLGIENADEVDDYIGDPLHYIDEQRRLGNTAGLQTVIDYANAKSAYEGMLERVRDDIDSRVEESDHTVDSHVNRTDGMIHPATLKEQNEDGTDKNVYIVSGNVVMTDDGSGVDTEKSDDTIVIRDAQTGEMQQVAPDAIFHVDDAIDPEEEKATAAEAIRQEMAQQAANNVDGTLPFAFGDSYTLTAPDGSQQSIAIVANEQGVVDNGDGTVNVTVDGQTVAPMSKEEIQQGVNATNMERTAQAEQERLAQQAETEQQRQAAEAEASRPQYGVNDIFTVTDENGMPIRGNVQGITGDGVEIYTEAPLNGKRVQMVPVEEFEGMVDSISDANGNQIWAREAVEQPTGDHIVDINNMVEDVEAGENKPSEASLSPTTPLTEEGATAEGEAPLTDEAAPTEHQPSALERVPKNEKGEPIYEQTDPATAWDAIVEQTGGNEQMAKTVADSMVADKETALKKAEKAKAKQGGTIAEKIAAEQERQAAIDNAKAELKHWQSIAMTQQSRRADAERVKSEEARKAAEARAEEEAKVKAEREEAERKEREAINGVPDWVDDTPQDARARGFRRSNGGKFDRQQPLVDSEYKPSEAYLGLSTPLGEEGEAGVKTAPIAMGKEVEVKFTDKVKQKGRVAVVEAAVMQPSHYNGQPNVLHFIPEAQPKKRTDDASVASSEDIAANMNPEEITSSVTAYTGAPTLNARGETIQGNNRTAALKRMWESHADQAAKYKQYLMDHAGEFGLNADDIAQMKQPVLANIVDVDDAKAIELGQYDVKDTESGGTERIKAKNAVVKMGTDMKHFASVLLSSSDDEASFSQLVDKNGDTVLKWMNQKGYITPTQYKSAFDSKGNLTAEAANDLKDIMYQSIFQNGNERLEEVFNTLPAKAQRAILATMYRDYDSPAAERMVPEVQASIMAYNELMQNDSFAGAKNMKEAQMAVMMWQRQYQFDDATGESYLPTEKYSNFALQLAAMYRVQTQSLIQGTFNQMFDLIQGTQEANLFNQDTLDNTPRTLVEAIKEALNIDYNGQQRNNVLAGNSAASQQRKQRSRGDASADGRGESGSRTAEREGGTESNSGRSENSQGNRGLQEQRDEGVQEVHVGLGEKETDGLLSQMEANAAEMPQLELNPSNWVSQFGEEGTVRTPIGQVKMGVNQIAKLFEKGRSEQFGMIKPTLENPQVIIEVPSESNDGNTERSSSLLFVKTFVGKDGKKIYYFKSVTVKKDGLEVSVSSHYDRVKRVKEALKNGKLLYRFDGGAQTEHHPADVSVTTSHEKGQGFSSADKVTNNHRELQTNNEKNTGREEDSLSSKIAAASEEVNTEPTEAQKKAGNYKKGHVQVGTFDITIEQPEGSIRRGTDANGKQWESKMHNTYGYFRGTEGVDGDHIDVFLSPDIDGWNGHKVYVVDQYNPDGTFDEHKVMLGFNDMDEAKSDYLANYEKGWENGRRIDVTAVNLEDFEKWIASSHRKTKPFGEYSSVKKDTDTTVKTGAYTIAPAQYTTKRGKVLDMQLVKFANELSMEQQRAAAAMAKEMKGWYDRAQGGFLMRSEEDARKLAEAVAENGEQLADAAPLSVSDLQEADEKQKEIGKAVEQTISDIVDTLSKDKVVVGTLKNSPNNPAFENLVYEKAQAIIIGDTERNLSNGVLKAFDNNELYRKIEKLVRERVNEDIFQKAERIAKEEEKKRTVKKPKSKEKEKPKNSGQFGLVSDERMEELKKRLRQKLGGQLNMGIDPEILAIGMELAAGHIDRGIKKFADFAKVMVEDMGDVIRPYLKAFYNGARDMPEVGDNGLAAEMTPYDEVRTFDVANFDKATPDALATAEQVVAEHEAEKQAKTATKKLKEKRNEAAKKLKTSKPAKEAADNFYDNGINEDAVAALPEDDAIHLHVVDILNPGMTDNSMKSKIDNFTYLLPKISDGKLAELDKEYGDDKIMGSHIKAEINRREEAKIDATDLPKLAKEKAKSALHGNGSMTDNAALAEAKRRIDKKRKTKTPQTEQRSLFDEPITNENDNGLQRDDDAVRTEAVQADRSGHGEGLSERTESGSKASEKGREAVDGTGARKGTGTDRTVQPRPANAVKEKRNTRNNHAERGEEFAPKSVDARIDANIKAIELAHELLESGEIATPEQMAVLRRFSGWGGLGAAFGDGGYDWKRRERNQKIRELLGNEAYEQAVLSANSAYYTPAYVVDTLWDIAAQLGFKGGRILEGSAGIGNILGQMPTAVSERSDIHAVEIDGTSGGILSLLYPDAKVEIQGFEQTRIPNGSVDLAITNVPFVAGMRVKDTTGDSDLAKKFYIQDFCIAKNVRKLREGGLGIFITSNGTLDSSKKLREWVTNEGGADFVGAFRMNNKTFGGTPVTSDIIVIRKRVNGQPSPNAIDVSTISGERMAEYDTGETRKVKGKEVPVVKQLSMDYNKYFIEHPENMAGEMHFGFEKGDTYRPTSKGLYPMSGKEQKQMLESFVLSLSKEEGAEKSTAPSADEVNSMVYDKLGKDVKEGSMVVDKNGRICLAQYGEAVPVMSKPKTGENASEEELIKRFQYKKIKKHTKAECFQSYSEIKTALNDVLAYQRENEGDEGLQPLLDKLNKAYDDFVKTYGHFNKNGQLAWLRRDVDYANVASVETFEERGDKNGNLVQTFGKADVMNGRVVEKEQEPHPENVKDGVVVSMFQSGRIDVPYIASQLGMSEEDVKQEIIDSGLGFEDPASRQMEVSYQYLSGNVREKLRLARENNEGGRYDKNIKALEDVKPMDIPSHLIDFTLGSSWIDSKLYDEYVKDRTDVDVHFTAVGGTWFMNAPEYGLNMEKNRAMGVTSEMLHRTVFGHALIEAAIQNRTITVSQTQKKWDGTTETITDREATQACAAKIDEIRQDFKEWARQKMQSDAEMSQRMERVYNDTFNNYVPMRIPDDFVPEYFGGASHKFKMRPHQGRAIVRGTMQPLLLAHEVGTGKTFTLISTAMEMRRLGTAHKPMIVVQNATVGQFVASAKELYPNAKILTLEDADRNAEGRKNFYAKIKYNDWDMIVVPQSTFEFIPDSEEREMAFVQDKIHEKEMVLEKMRETDKKGNSMILRQAERELNDLNNQLATLSDKASKKRNANDEKKKAVARQNATVKAQEMLDRRTDDVDNFDDMGIDALLIDEAHEYKHLGFATAMQRGVKGVDSSYSKKSQGVYLKTQAVLEKNHGRNVVFATGTPISNTAAEIWTFMRYLMPKDTMEEYGIYYFDDFVRNFGNIQQMLEFTTSGKFKENNRFAGYVNLPELVRIWSSVSDTVLTREAGGVKEKIPELEGGKAQDLYLPQTRALRSIMKYVKHQLDEYDKMSGKEKKENSHIPLTMYGIAKAAAVDARLVQSDAEDDGNSKTNESVRQTLRSLKETESYKGTVAIFADNYQNKHSGFNLYEDIRQKLIEQGVPANEIVVMKSGMTVKKKLDIFDKVNRGEVRVILGSTFTLGTGVNIQERLHTLIHLDAPNRPMDYTQRNGRILRQGNLHKEMGKPVRVLRFGVEDSLDVTAYQRLKTKGAIADSVMNGKELMQDSMNNRVLEEDEDVFGDTVAQLSGSEYAMLKNNAEKNVRKYESRRKQWEADQTYIHNAKPRLEGKIKADKERAEKANKHLFAVQTAFPDGKAGSIKVGKKEFASVDAMADFIKEHNKKILDEVKAMKDNPKDETRTHKLTLSMGGYDFTVKTEMQREMSSGGGQLFAEVHRKMTYSCQELGLENVPVKQSLLRNAIEDITENVITGKDFAEQYDAATRSMKHNQSELEQIRQREGKTFEYEKELEEAKRQYIEYSEAMKHEMEEKEKKYAEMDKDVAEANDVEYTDEEDDDADEDMYRIVDDEATIERLDSEPKMTAYRAMQVIDGRLYSPMAAKVDGKLTADNPVGAWTEAEETVFDFTPEQKAAMEKLDNSKKKGDVEIIKGKLRYHKESEGGRGTLQFHLVKGDGTSLWAAYNPYIHSSLMMLNDQFTSAYKRPNIVVVEVEIPKSELTSGYRAERAKDPVGIAEWKAGPVAGQLPSDMGRKVMLSRWSKVKRIVPYAEVADHVASILEAAEAKNGERLTLPIDSFHPELRKELEKRGFKFEYGQYTKEKTDKNGNVQTAWDEKSDAEKRKAYKGASYMDDAAINELNEELGGKWLKREGEGAYSDEELSWANDPMSKMLGRNRWSKRQQGEFAARERERMASRVEELVGTLHLNNVEVVTDASMLEGRRKRAKGFYNKRSGKITIVIPNHASMADVEQTLLHEAVAHYGLRELFGEQFDTFLDNVYSHAELPIRKQIAELARKNDWDFRKATEEYLASLAEDTDFEGMNKGRGFYGWWSFVKRAFLDMLHKIGFGEYDGPELSDNELRYILWRSYENLKEPGRYRSILGEAADMSKQLDLKVGNFAEREELPMDKASEEDMFRDGNSVDYEKAQARNRYEERVSRGMYQMQEAMQDSMLGLKEAMDAILGGEGKKQYIEDVAGYENAYLGENRLSSVNQAECTAFARTLFKPLLEEVAKLAKTADERAELTDYMMAKHGLERNEVMRERAKEKLIEEKMGKEKPKEPNPDDVDYDIKMVAYDAAMDAWENAVEVKLGDKLSAIEERDFSGLTALTGMNNVVDAEAEAQRMVSDYESNHDTADLWGRVNDVTSATLSKTYESGLISKTTYDDIRTMYKHYIPLRGFDDKTSDEAYAYLQDKHSAFNAPIKTAKGRKSKADDPFANMESMAESAIMQGNRNVLVKQKFLNFVLNHPSDLVSVSDLWLRYDDAADEWKPVNTGDVAGTERLEETDSPAEVERKMQDFEAAMEQLAAQEPDKWKKQKENPAIPYRVVESRDLRQHQVLVKRGGKDYLLTINGNPRAAQALNGQTNPDNDTSGAIGAILHAGEVLNRHLSAFYTTRNPDFVVSNFMRDALYANTMVWVKESPNYAIRFHKNFGKVNPAKMKMLFGKLRNGTLDMNDEVEKMFHQFMLNGGETGYANIRDIEQRKNDIKRELKKYNGKLPIRKAWDLLGERFDEYNRAVENCARFAAFMTSRQMKRSIDRSIYDAKEISVNFNKKGSGAKFMGAVGQTKTGNIAAFVSGLGRSGYVFWNAALQGATNFGRQTMQHPKKALVGMAAMFLLGVLTAGFGGGDGDDDDDKNSYYNLPEYVRRSNIVFRMPWMKEQWISIPLPVEYRSMYGMGELMTSVISGKEHYTGGEIANQIAGQMSQMLPIDFMEGGGSFKAFVPSAVKPYAEVMTNKGWTGMPLYKDTPYNQDMPEWTKAYKSANKYLVGLSKTLNDISGGDAYTKGLVDINSAKVEYLLNGYFGGVSTTIDKLTKTGETILGDREYDPRSFLILNRLVKNGDERTENRAINNEYFRLKEEHDKLKARLKHYEDDTDNGVFDYAEKIDWLYNSPEYRRLEIFEDYAPDIDAINKELKEPMSDAERKQLEADLNEIKKDLVEEVNKTRKRK